MSGWLELVIPDVSVLVIEDRRATYFEAVSSLLFLLNSGVNPPRSECGRLLAITDQSPVGSVPGIAL